MATLSQIEKESESCKNQLAHMCKSRDLGLRICVLPRCCGICEKVLYCEGKCKILKERFETSQ